MFLKRSGVIGGTFYNSSSGGRSIPNNITSLFIFFFLEEASHVYNGENV